MATVEEPMSLSLIGKDEKNDVQWSWSYPSISADSRELLRESCLKAKEVIPFCYGQLSKEWYYLHTSVVKNSTEMSKVTHVTLVLVAKDFNPEKYEGICRTLCNTLKATGSPDGVLQYYLSLFTKGTCPDDEDNTFPEKEFVPTKDFTEKSTKDDVQISGAEAILTNAALLMKEGITFLGVGKGSQQQPLDHANAMRSKRAQQKSNQCSPSTQRKMSLLVRTLVPLALMLFCTSTFPGSSAMPFFPKTFSVSRPHQPITNQETPLMSHSLSPGANMGIVTHVWSVICGGTPPPHQGMTVYNFYFDGEALPSISYEVSMAAGIGFHDPFGPWGTDMIGKGSNLGAYYINIKMPFYESVRVTAQFPLNPINVTTDVFTIIRGVEVDYRVAPIVVGGMALPHGTRLFLQKRKQLKVASLDFIPLVSLAPPAKGVIFQTTLAVQTDNLQFLEGCFHLYTPFNQSFPGTLLSTGGEDYYDSSYYFQGGPFHYPVSGVTHICSPDRNGRPPTIKPCPDERWDQTEFSAYRFHDKDALFFSDGVKLEMRNGDSMDKDPFDVTRQSKCYTLDKSQPVGNPSDSIVDVYAWIYVFPDSP